MNNQFLHSFDLNIKGKFSYLPSHNSQMTIQTIKNITLISSGLNSNMFNILYSNESTDRASVKIAIDFFRTKKTPYAFWIGFEDDPSWLEEELLSLGLLTDETEWAMLCNLEEKALPVIFSDFKIKQVNDLAGIQDIIYVMNTILPPDEHAAIQSFYEQSSSTLLSKRCPLTFFVGYRNSNPISLSSSFYDQGITSIFDVIVLPEMRGRGFGKAMTLKAMQAAQENGYKECVLTATNDAKYLYQKLGFENFKTMKVYHES